jgi:hypothetical protein
MMMDCGGAGKTTTQRDSCMELGAGLLLVNPGEDCLRCSGRRRWAVGGARSFKAREWIESPAGRGEYVSPVKPVLPVISFRAR